MPGPVPRKGLASASLALGFLGLLTAGGCGVGALVGLALAIVVLTRRDPAYDSGRDLAWAGIVTNGLALLTIGPVVMLAALLHGSGSLPFSGEEELPEPHVSAGGGTDSIEPPPPPPPPPPSPSKTAGSGVREASPAAATGPQRAGAVRVGGAIREPAKLRHVNPAYPEMARQARVQGVVILEATVSATGKVTSVRVLRGVPLLSEAAVEAVKQWEYAPTLLHGVPVPVIMTVTVTFRLS